MPDSARLMWNGPADDCVMFDGTCRSSNARVISSMPTVVIGVGNTSKPWVNDTVAQRAGTR